MEKFNVLSLTEKQKTPLLRGSWLNPIGLFQQHHFFGLDKLTCLYLV
jgi:hypothetical protein